VPESGDAPANGPKWWSPSPSSAAAATGNNARAAAATDSISNRFMHPSYKNMPEPVKTM
jgi:hypothetical protein